jgi:formate-dependent nitrite reductase cytochrome c552 subunit
MRRILLSAGLCLLLFSFAAEAGRTQSPPPPSQTMPSGQATPPIASDFVGSEICATCHDESAKNFASNPHARLSLEHNGKGITCESCHGPAKAHVDGGGDVTKIRQLGKLSAAEVDETCLACHAAATRFLKCSTPSTCSTPCAA